MLDKAFRTDKGPRLEKARRPGMIRLGSHRFIAHDQFVTKASSSKVKSRRSRIKLVERRENASKKRERVLNDVR